MKSLLKMIGFFAILTAILVAVTYYVENHIPQYIDIDDVEDDE